MRPAQGVRAHQAALQAIADANGGNRAAGLPGYTGSVEYVVDTLEAAGWNVTLDEFPFTFIPPPTLQQLTPVAATYETGAFTGSGFGTVTGNVIPVDINLVAAAGHARAVARRPTSSARTSAARVRHRPDPARDVHVRGQGGSMLRPRGLKR